MPANDNPHAIRLYESLTRNVGEDAAREIMQGNPLSKAADHEKKFRWAERICAGLERTLDHDAVKKVRMDCACGPDTGKISKLTKLFQSSSHFCEFAEKVNALNEGFTVNAERDALFLVYPQCYCSCVKRVTKPISQTWCYCTLGYTKKMFEGILGRDVYVELISSVKTGGESCVIKITPRELSCVN
ncbi:MAG: DUF6144 family protein [Oscillospiraceae bacterium]|jgi:predicted hydrocarbon binding protein|nr:DUF6144 family protein [Oscillospiraceae bacterium]